MTEIEMKAFAIVGGYMIVNPSKTKLIRITTEILSSIDKSNIYIGGGIYEQIKERTNNK